MINKVHEVFCSRPDAVIAPWGMQVSDPAVGVKAILVVRVLHVENSHLHARDLLQKRLLQRLQVGQDKHRLVGKKRFNRQGRLGEVQAS